MHFSNLQRAWAYLAHLAHLAQSHHSHQSHQSPLPSEPAHGPTPGAGAAIILLELWPADQSYRADEALRLLEQLQQSGYTHKSLLLCPARATGDKLGEYISQALTLGVFDILYAPCSSPMLQQSLDRAQLFLQHELQRQSQGKTSLNITATLSEGLRQAAATTEEKLLRNTLGTCNHNVSETARRLGLEREQIYYYLKKYGIQRPVS